MRQFHHFLYIVYVLTLIGLRFWKRTVLFVLKSNFECHTCSSLIEAC